MLLVDSIIEKARVSYYFRHQTLLLTSTTQTWSGQVSGYKVATERYSPFFVRDIEALWNCLWIVVLHRHAATNFPIRLIRYQQFWFSSYGLEVSPGCLWVYLGLRRIEECLVLNASLSVQEDQERSMATENLGKLQR